MSFSDFKRLGDATKKFHLRTQDDASISERSLDGRIYVASFIFTRCAAVCPILVRELTRVQSAIAGIPAAHIVSFSVTPDEDTPQILAAFGKARGIDSSRWSLVTGDKDQIYRLARESYFADDNRVGPETATGSEAFLHTEKLVLVDGKRRLRGVYNGTQPHDVDQLIDDLRRLTAERQPTLAGQVER